MNPKFPLAILCVVMIIGCDRKQSNKIEPVDKDQIVVGVVDTLQSKILNETRKVWVFSPEDTTKRYPVLVLLDGEAHYKSVLGLVDQLSHVNGNTQVPEMVIVAILNTDRTRDLTPTHVAEIFGDSAFAKKSGGGENFTRFIAEELLPFIDSKYPTTSYRTLVGHSFGGLFAINTIIHHPEIFSNYLAIDPSMWWDKRKLTDQAVATFTDPKYKNKSLFVGVANTMPEGMPYEKLAGDTSQNTYHMRSILDFNERVGKIKSGMRFITHYYPEDDHSSVPLIATHDGLRKFFEWHTLRGINKFFDSGNTATPEEIVAHIKKHYQNVSQHFGYEVVPPEKTIEGLAYGFLGNKMPARARALFEMNVQNFPRSATAYDGMGNYYLDQKDTLHAKENFEKALGFQPLDYVKEKLDKLK